MTNDDTTEVEDEGLEKASPRNTLGTNLRWEGRNRRISFTQSSI